jgi:alkanesulfonate monooxygenase SsuD/methylene tetrahydromethanopterin reductase-like flavin-dependent oxidoreductase (luciferase family)
VADLADWWCADVEPLEAFVRKSAVLTAHSEALGRDPPTVVRSQVAWIDLAAGPGDRARWPDVHIVAGGPDAVTSELLDFRRAGVDHFQLRFMDFPATDGLECFIDRVLPNLRAGWD